MKTVKLSDTIDQYSRKLHVNIRGKKVTMVLRWKDSASHKAHTQRVTFEHNQLGSLLGLLCSAGDSLGDKTAGIIANALRKNSKEFTK